VSTAGIGPVSWQASRVTEPGQGFAVVAPVTVSWTSRLFPGVMVSALLLLVAGLMFTSTRGDAGRRAQIYLYFALLLSSVAIFYVGLILRAVREQPVALTIAYPALWFSGSRSPFATELSRREGSMLRVSTIRRIRLLTLVRPDGSAPRQIGVEARVLLEIRAAALSRRLGLACSPGGPGVPAGLGSAPDAGGR